jgi:hypothetical protein
VDDLRNFPAFQKDGIQIIQSESATGDQCHYDLSGAKDRSCEQFFKTHFLPDRIYFCCNDATQPISSEQYEYLHDYVQSYCSGK